MALNIKDTETEKLAAEVAELTGLTKEDAMREALREKKERLEMRRGRRSGSKGRPVDMQKWLETEIWPRIPNELLDREPMSKKEVEDLLGFGPEGY